MRGVKEPKIIIQSSLKKLNSAPLSRAVTSSASLHAATCDGQLVHVGGRDPRDVHTDTVNDAPLFDREALVSVSAQQALMPLVM